MNDNEQQENTSLTLFFFGVYNVLPCESGQNKGALSATLWMIDIPADITCAQDLQCAILTLKLEYLCTVAADLD